MKLILALCASLVCLVVCSSANAQTSTPAADTPDPAQVQQVLALLNNWPDTCSDQLGRMAQVDQFSTQVIKEAIHQFANRAEVEVSTLKQTGSGVDSNGGQYKTYQLPSEPPFSGGEERVYGSPLQIVNMMDLEGEYIVCTLMRYLFRVSDEVTLKISAFQNGMPLSENFASPEWHYWYYNAPVKHQNSKTVVLDTLWPLQIGKDGRISFIWPDSFRSPNTFNKVGSFGGAALPPELYITAFDYCSDHYPRRNLRRLGTQAQSSPPALYTAVTSGEAPTRANTQPASAPQRQVSPMSINRGIAHEQETRISFGSPFVESACMSPDRKYVAYVRNDHRLFVWSLHPLRLVGRYTLYPPGAPAASPNLYGPITFLQRGRVLALLFSDGSLDFASPQNGHVIKQDTRRSNSDTVLTQFLRWPDRIARLTSDGRLLVTNVSGSSEKQWRVPGGKMLAAAMSQDGSVLATEGASGRIRIFNTRTHRLLVSDNGMLEFYCLWNTFSDNGSLFACMGRTAETIATWSTPNDQFKSNNARWFIQQVAVSPDGHYIAVAEPGTVELLGLSGNRQVRRLSSSAIKVISVGGNVTCLQFARSNRTLLIGLEGGDVTLWNLSRRGNVLLEAK